MNKIYIKKLLQTFREMRLIQCKLRNVYKDTHSDPLCNKQIKSKQKLTNTLV